jgi:hypothetical protein
MWKSLEADHLSMAPVFNLRNAFVCRRRMKINN